MAAEAGETALRLRPVEDGDRFRLRRWLGEPHVVQWFGSRAAAEASLALAAESDTAIARMIVLDGEAIGYAHALDLDDPRLSPGCWQADVFIGAADHRGQGFGGRALGMLRDEVFSATLAPALAIRLPLGREKSIRAVEREGFQWSVVDPDPVLGPCWFMVAERGRG